ncbi:MAG: restriction endonuclease subunit S [Lachnospiraceae bacterium]|nr:restriction endonuclease subunit S [Lachnospiraceae bacterium]
MVNCQSRFIEMFGDPVSNPYGYDKVALSELADIKIGPFGSLLHKEDYIENGHPLLNPSHIVDGKVVPDPKLTISDGKYEELSAYHLKIGDVVMGRRGEMGRCAVVPSKGYLCGTGSILIRSKGEVTADYIQKIISFPSFKKTIEDMAVGQTMPNLNVPIVANFQVIKPPMEIQDSYYSFVIQVDKSKYYTQLFYQNSIKNKNNQMIGGC